MTEMIKNLAQISGRYAAIYCDLWGVLHNGVAAYPAAVAALRGFRKRGGKVILLTNSPRPRSSVEQQLAALSVPRDAWDDIASSGDAAQAALIMGAVGRRVYHLGPAKDDAFFNDLDAELATLAMRQPAIERVGALAQATGVVCTGLFDDQTETPADYRATLLEMKARELPMLCANPDVVVDLGEKRIYCAGALAVAYADMGGEVQYYGKPHAPIYDLARRRLSALLGRDDVDVLAIGDGIATDIQGGMAEGLDTLFITSGVCGPEFGPDPATPDPALLAAWLTKQQLSPTYTLPFFG